MIPYPPDAAQGRSEKAYSSDGERLGGDDVVLPVRAHRIPGKRGCELVGGARGGVGREAGRAGEPSEQGRGRTEALPELAHVEVVVALGEPSPVGRKQERYVRIGWLRELEEPLQVDLARRRGEQVAAAHDLRHAHLGVIHHDGELVGEDPIASPHQKIPACTCEHLALFPVHAVGERDGAGGVGGIRYAQA